MNTYYMIALLTTPAVAGRLACVVYGKAYTKMKSDPDL